MPTCSANLVTIDGSGESGMMHLTMYHYLTTAAAIWAAVAICVGKWYGWI